MPTVDAHIDVPWQFQKHGPFDLRDHPTTAVDFKRMKEGDLHGIICALYLSDKMQDELGPEASAAAIDRQINWIRLQTIPKPTVYLGLEGGRLIPDIARLRWLAEAGIRYLTITHNRNTHWADSATDKPYHRGLTRFGFDVCAEAIELGVLLDISHASDETAEDVLYVAAQEVPVIASHSGCRAVLDHPRNISDHLMRMVADSGGVIHIPFARRFVGTFDGVIDHIEHVMMVTGSYEYVGIGSDLDGAAMVEGLEDVSKWSRVGNALAKRGYGDDVIAAITGRNTLRLLER